MPDIVPGQQIYSESEGNQRRWQCGWQTKRKDREDLKEGMWIIRLCRSTYGHGRYQTEVSLGDTLGWPHILGTHTAGGQASKSCVWLFTITFSLKKNKLQHSAWGPSPDRFLPASTLHTVSSQPNRVKLLISLLLLRNSRRLSHHMFNIKQTDI